MPFLNVKNRAESTLAADITDVATSLSVTAGGGVKFPATNFHITIDDEIILCSSRSTDTLTVVRAREGTTGVVHSSGATVELRITAKIIEEIQQARVFDAVVAASGGDYTTLGAAIAGGAISIFVKDGTYAEGAITGEGYGNQIIGAKLQSSLYEMRQSYMKNTSGGTLDVGDIVILKAVAAGNEITTTTTAGDDKVFGMVSKYNILDTASGYVQTLGKTTRLKVDGTTDIAIGDFLSTFTTAKIAKKAAAGDTAFAIALEAYTTDNSLGVLDALLITPRKIGVVV